MELDYRQVIESKYNRQNWQLLLRDIFKNRVEFWATPYEISTNSALSKQTLWLGTITLSDDETIAVYEVELSDNVDIERNRRGIRDMLLTEWRNRDAGAFMFCYRKTESVLRFSYVSESWNFAEDGSYQKESTDTKRFTYLLGEGHRSRTAIQQFEILKKSDLKLRDLTKAFSVEAVSKMFFDDYKKNYEDIIQYITGKRMVKVANKWEEKVMHDPCEEIMDEFAHFPNPEKAVRDYVKKLMGRLVFLQFLQKKGWLGVPVGKPWGEGNPEFIQQLFAECSDKEHFVDNVLEELFNDLNTERTNDLVSSAVGHNIRVPYLNGGLFEREATDETEFPLPARYMQQMLDFFASYNFTIDENDPDDAEVGVDPEMLGRIFENLLEDNKDKGAFYTPKEIVTYMCRESLIAYLQTDIEDEETKEAIRQFVTTHEKNDKLPADTDQKLKDVKICDPAIGSGAFPMGLLKELFQCRTALEGIDQSKAAEIKKHIIQNNIYGVDIERGAVDIARLRFWLSLIIDEENPQALPNLDFKIMQGNSLSEQYKDVDLSSITNLSTEKEGVIQLTWFDNQLDLLRFELRDLLSKYYNCTNHKEKRLLRQDIDKNVKSQLVEQKIEINFEDVDLSGNDIFFLWHTWFYEVFEKGGFDIFIGNPPYNGISVNNGSFIKGLIEDYKLEPGTNNALKERKLWLQDDYVKFIRLVENNVSLSNHGIVAYINNNSFIDNPTFRGMRWHLLNTFDEIKILDLHGNTRKNNIIGVDGKDENVFNIMQGVSINTFIKTRSNPNEGLSKTYYSEICGPRQKKLRILSTPQSAELVFNMINPCTPFYFFKPHSIDGIDDFNLGFSIPEIMPVCVTGVVTARDGLVIDLYKNDLLKKIKLFVDESKSDDEIRKIFFGNKKSSKYLPGDSRGWSLSSARKKIRDNDHEKYILPLAFRVFDNRYIYYSSDMVDWGREEIYTHIINRENYCLVVPRQTTKEWRHVFVSDKVANFNFLATGGQNGAGTHFPLFRYNSDGEKIPNINTEIKKHIEKNVGRDVSPEEIFDYIYGILHSNSYRSKFMEFLKVEFPKIPYPNDIHDFLHYCQCGENLRLLHLFKNIPSNINLSIFKGIGNNEIVKISYKEGKVYINQCQFFDNVPIGVWETKIGDDMPAERWLKERKGRVLSSMEIEYYQKMIYILNETNKIIEII